ncbi:MAG: hypothetical protein A2Y31_05650 [Spirochaetes bacterium GWC2_52_13]|nr:MAG: hypothetical protein A2Y31_05650 [Spirochaetes bacterium GWC2_52_13]
MNLIPWAKIDGDVYLHPMSLLFGRDHLYRSDFPWFAQPKGHREDTCLVNAVHLYTLASTISGENPRMVMIIP